ncbi:hypothetical protein FACS189494_11170 [Spirochaetia bacterium]|nr:hypothetical protein FACS189494_11170 [Spirochaetia bacterium]
MGKMIKKFLRLFVKRLNILDEHEIRILGIPVLQYGSRILFDGTEEKFVRLFHKKLEHQFLDYILTLVPEKHDFIFLIRTNGSGEIYLLNFMLDEFIAKHKIKNPVFVSHRAIYGDMLAMFNDIPFYHDKNISLQFWNAVLLRQTYRYRGKTFHVHHATLKVARNFLALAYAPDFSGTYVDFVRKNTGVSKIVYHDPIISDDIMSSAKEKTAKQDINLDKFVFFVTDAQGTKMLPVNFWIALSEQLQSSGYDVFVNTKDGITKFGKSAALTISEAYYIAGFACAIVALRCGLAELLTTLHVPLHTLYTSYRVEEVSAEQCLKLLTLKAYPNVDTDNIFEYNTEIENLEIIANKILGAIVK